MQKLSNGGSSGNGSFPVLANKKYRLKVNFILDSLSSTTGTFSFGILGTASISNIYGLALSSRTSTLITSSNPSSSIITSVGATVLAAPNTVGFAKAQIELDFTTSTSGTIIPSFAVSQSASPRVIYLTIKLEELGTDTQTSSSDIV